MPFKLFKKKEKKATSNATSANKEGEMVYSMTPRHGHAQDVLDENGIRQVAGCLPIDPINKRFLLISSSSNPDTWVIPKGGWEKDETQKQAAMRETWEEAGVKGVITRHIGVFAEKSKTGVKAHHWIYEMEIKEVTKKFPEQGKRQRRWFDYEEAMLAVKAHYIHDALSMSSLSPLIHEDEGKKKKKKKKKVDDESPENSDNEEDKKKKKKEKKKKDKERDPIDETLSFNDESDIEKSKKEKKKDNMKSSKKEDDDSIEEVQVDEPLEKKNKKKGKKKNKGEAGTEIIELSDKDIPKFSTENNPSIVVTDDVDQLNQQINAVTIDVPPVSEQHSLKEQVYPAKKQNNFTENTPPVEYEQQLPRPQEPPSNPHYPSK